MNTRNLEKRVLIAVQAPPPVRFAAIFLGDPSKAFYSAVLKVNLTDSSKDNRDSEFERFMSWVKSVGALGFAAWGTEGLAFLQGYLRHHFTGGWFDLCSFVDGMDGNHANTFSSFWNSGLETLLKEQANRALALVQLCELRASISSFAATIPSLGTLRY